MNDVYVKYKNLSEEDTKRIEITPAITNKGWHSETQIRMEYLFTNGRIMVKDKENHFFAFQFKQCLCESDTRKAK